MEIVLSEMWLILRKVTLLPITFSSNLRRGIESYLKFGIVIYWCLLTTFVKMPIILINPNSRDNKGSCWILKDFYCSVTMLRELVLMNVFSQTSRPIQMKHLQVGCLMFIMFIM